MSPSELGSGDPSAIVFAANTHDFLIRLAAACPRSDPQRLRVLMSDGEFHSARRQFARWAEDGWLELETVAAEPFDDFSARFLAAAQRGDHDLILVSQVLFGSGRRFDRVERLAALRRPEGPWVVIDGYHASWRSSRRSRQPPRRAPSSSAAAINMPWPGKGWGFMHCPPGYGPRPPLTGWYAEFDDLTLPPGHGRLCQGCDALHGRDVRSVGAVSLQPCPRGCSAEHGLTTARISAHVAALQAQLLDAIAGTALGQAELLNPLDGAPHARFLAFRSPTRRALVRRAWRRAIASPTCAATCCGSGSACIMTRPTSTRFARARGGSQLGLQPVAQQRVGVARDRLADPRRPTRRSAGRGRR